jgi:hypothetical protein
MHSWDAWAISEELRTTRAQPPGNRATRLEADALAGRRCRVRLKPRLRSVVRVHDRSSGRDPDQFRDFLTRLTRFARLNIDKIL